MSSLLQDLRFGFRTLTKNPGFTAIAVLTLALGIGANTAIFSVVNATLLRPLPYRDPGRLCLLAEHTDRFPTFTVSYENYLDWRSQNRSFESVEATRSTTMTLTGAGEPQRLDVRMATAGLFSMLGIRPELGRTFLPEEDRAGAAGVALISDPLWQAQFGARPDVIGKTLELDTEPYTIVGVLPPAFEVLHPADVFVPFEPWAKTLPDDRSWHPGIWPIGRLKPGVNVRQAAADMQTIAAQLAKQYRLYDTGVGALVTPFQDQLVQNVRPALLVLLGAVGFVLLIACANVANLLLAQAARRGKEIAIRRSLGATRRRLITQLLVESLLLTVIGAALGLVLARLALAPLMNMAVRIVPSVQAIRIDGSVLLFTLALCVGTSLLFGLLPAVRATKLDLRENLNDGARGSTAGMSHQRVRSALVIVETALAMLLLIGAGLLLRSFEGMQRVSPGFSTQHLLAVDLPLSPNAYAKPEQRFAFFDQLMARAAALPGVRSIGGATTLPVSGAGGILHFNIYGRPPKSAHDFIMAGYRAVTPNYLETLGVPLLQGRTFTEHDDEKAPAVVVLNATMARVFFGGVSPLGQRMQLGALPEKSIPWMEVVGVVGDVKPDLGSNAQAEMYVPFKQVDALLPVYSLSMILRTSGDPFTEVGALRSAVHDIDANQPVVKVRSMEQNISSSMVEPRFRTLLLALFGLLALVLAAIGIYGVMAHSVVQRTHEIGVRVTLGAETTDVMRLILGQGMRLAIAGVLIGWISASALMRILSKFLFGVTPLDPATFVTVAFLLAAVALLACYIPAQRAARVDPMVALRHE